MILYLTLAWYLTGLVCMLYIIFKDNDGYIEVKDIFNIIFYACFGIVIPIIIAYLYIAETGIFDKKIYFNKKKK